MLFNSYEFIFGFLPVVLAVFILLGRYGGLLGEPRAVLAWLAAASLFFYGWWEPRYLLLLIPSICLNFLLGRVLQQDGRSLRLRRALAAGGIFANLAAIAWFKYSWFAAENLSALLAVQLDIPRVVLPLAISFFTFQQIAYLADSYSGRVREASFLNYVLFVSFFPQLIAGPIVHHAEMMPQFASRFFGRLKAQDIAIGLTIFVLGLFKKVVLADSIAPYGNSVFAEAAQGASLDFFRAWSGALAYSLQLYFDFSGYSDMAIGLARLFGIRLPINFFSPYKALSIVDFWRRWHMTLSRFLRDYLYIALGGNRHGPLRRYGNLMATMVLGGLWHGAGWTFVFWGFLHGAYLVVCHLWQAMVARHLPASVTGGRLYTVFAWSLTLLAVIVGWVFFRATSFDAAVIVLKGMAGGSGLALPNALVVRLGFMEPVFDLLGVEAYLGGGAVFVESWVLIGLLGLLALAAPNTMELMRRYRPVVGVVPPSPVRLSWRPVARWAGAVGVLGALSLLSLTRVSDFLYFQF